MHALRPLRVALYDEPAWRRSALAGIMDRLTGAVDTLAAVLRDRLPADAARPKHWTLVSDLNTNMPRELTSVWFSVSLASH